jgi:phosphatidylinositol dimannoside acyltransferase
VKVDTARLYTFAWRHAGRLPGWLVRGAGIVAADLTWALRLGGVDRLEANLARVRPDLDARGLRRLGRLAMRSYLRYFGEAFTLSPLTTAQIDARVRVVGLENLARPTREGHGVVLALGHLGNWDLAGAWARRHVAPVTTVAERLEPAEVFDEFVRFRESLGLKILALGDPDVFRTLVREVRDGPVIVPLLADRDLTSKGVEVDLFGRRARVAAGPAALALTADAPLLTTVIMYERLHGARRRAAGSPWGIRLDFIPVPPLPDDVPRAERVGALTQAWVDQLAVGITQRAQDWHMLQRVFVEDLDPERYAQTRARAGETDVRGAS